MRVNAALVAICIGVLAGAAGAATYLAFGFNGANAFIVAIAVLTSLGLFNAVSAAFGLRGLVGRQLADFARTSAALARQVAELDRRLAGLENRLESGFEKTHAAVDPLLIEVDKIGTVVKQLNSALSQHEAVLKSLAPSALAEARTALPADLGTGSRSPAAGAQATAETEEMVAAVRAALDADRLEPYLQPIVTLPERKVSFYEAMVKFRGASGELLPPEAVAQAKRSSLISRIDNLALTRCIQIVRRLLLKDRAIAVFYDVAMASLKDQEAFARLRDLLEANRALANSIVLGLGQADMRNAGSTETDNLATLAERGFRFCMDQVVDLGIEPHVLSTRGFRFVKIPAGLLLRRAGTAAAQGDPANLADLLVRFEIDVIAERIEDDDTVVELIDRDIKFGQGGLFSPPRPVRSQALESTAEREPLMHSH